MSIAVQERLEPEGITFIGSTYAEVREGVVLLNPQAERIEPDRIVSLDESGALVLASQSRAGGEQTLLARPSTNSLASHGHQSPGAAGAARPTH